MNRNEELFELMKELEENTPDLSSSIRKAKCRRNRIVFAYRPLVSLAACFVLFVLLVNFSAPVAQACANVPFLQALVEAVTFDRSLSNAVENDYVQQMDLVQEENGITAKIEYVIVDQKQVNIFYRLESEDYQYMYGTPEILSKDGSTETLFKWTIRSDEDLRHITLDYLGEAVPDSIQLVLYVFDESQGEDHTIAQFTFLLEFDLEAIAEAKIYPVNQTVILDGQSITITDVEVYPTHLRVNTVDAADNTAWLRTLDFYIETENGRFDIPGSGIIATGTEEGRNSFRADSIYFYDAEEIKLVITGARWLSKDMGKIEIDLTTGEADGLPKNVTLVPVGEENSMSPVMLHIQGDGDADHHMMLELAYYDAEGNKCQTSVGTRDCGEHSSNCWYEWLDLSAYPYDCIEIQLTYTDDWEAENPVIINVR